jgi:uncharacterized protein
MSKKLEAGERRSAGSLQTRRIKHPWPKGRDFRILSIDGGGIKGIFPAAILAGLEKRLGGGQTISDFFDLIAGTSTGGIIALGLGAEINPSKLLELYEQRGGEIFPPYGTGRIGRFIHWLKGLGQLALYRYDSKSLKALLTEILGDRLYGESRKRLCIPAFEAKHSEVAVYKTPHHSDYKTDLYIPMVDVALSTSAAPGYFRPHQHNGYTLVDGGVWANNPIMIAVIEVLTAFDVTIDQIKVLSIGCGDAPYKVGFLQKKLGGFFFWRKIIEGSIRLVGMNVTNQIRLLLGPERVLRLEPQQLNDPIDLDDWLRAKEILPAEAYRIMSENFEKIERMFLHTPVMHYIPENNSSGENYEIQKSKFM